MPHKKHLLIIAGPTGVGKTALSIVLAKHFNTEVISADSRQVYQELSIGTAKPGLAERQGVKHHLLDCVSIHQHFTAGDFEREALKTLQELFAKHDLVILCGGTGLYIDALCNGFDEGLVTDPDVKNEIEKEFQQKGLSWLQEEIRSADPGYYSVADIHNHRRLLRALEVIRLSGLPYSSFRQNKKAERDFEIIKVLINEDREILYDKINQRVDHMMKNGLLEEVKGLVAFKDKNALNTVGYKELFDHLEGKTTLENAVESIKQHSRNYAKRQLTWFRKSNDYEVFGPAEAEKVKAYVEIILQNS